MCWIVIALLGILFFAHSSQFFQGTNSLQLEMQRNTTTKNDRLVDHLLAQGLIKTNVVENTMRYVDRGDYSAKMNEAFEDSPHSIGYGQTISAPHMHAMCLELLAPYVTRKQAKVLDVGSGSGYLTACLGRMIGLGGKVIGIDVVRELVDWANTNLNKHEKELLTSGTVLVKMGDGWKGDPANGPYDAIHVGAAAETLPQALVEQLAPNGRMVIPVGTSHQKLIMIDKAEDGTITKTDITGVRYVPLVKGKS